MATNAVIKNALQIRILLLTIAYIGFVSLGLPDPLIGVAWPSVRETFKLNQSAVALVFFGSGCAYFLSSIFAGKLLNRLGVGLLLAVSSAVVALAEFNFGLAPLWILFAMGSLLHGLGSGAIDTALNHYVAHHFSARHMNWLHACYSLGATLGPLIMTTMIATASSTWRAGYITVGSILLALAALFFITRHYWIRLPAADTGVQETSCAPEEPVSSQAALKNSLVWLHVIFFFVYAGIELVVGQWSFTVLTEARGMSPEKAGLWVTCYWASIGVGRVFFGFVVDRLGIDRLLRLCTFAAALGVLLFVLNLSVLSSALSLSLIGFCLAAIFPCMMTRTPQRLGSALATHAIGFQVGAAMLGAAALPSLAGVLAQHRGAEAAAIVALVLAVVLLLIHEGILAKSRIASGGHTTVAS